MADDPALLFGGAEDDGRTLVHPVAAFFHVAWKVAALAFYLTATFYMDNFVLTFIVMVLLLSFDFWTVKNVTGRLLVGLRWWNEVREDGTTHWVFESHEDHTHVRPLEKRIFWLGLTASTAVWGLLGVWCVLTFKFTWLLVVAVALGFHVSNTVGYFKCAKDARSRLQGLARSYIGNGLIDAAMSRV